MPDLVADLRAHLLPGDVLDGHADRLQWAGDASIYHLVPRVVVFPRRSEDLVSVLAVAQQHRVGVTLRAGGTSLSGQASGDGILVVVSRHLREIILGDGGRVVACGPGAVAAWVNAALAPHGRKLGPDPASLQAAEIGGIVANNASGMCCGVTDNSYRTVTRLQLVLAEGARVDTADESSVPPAIAAGLLALRDEVRADTVLSERIRRGFATKNTVGYGINAFLEADTPAAILQKLVVGSEGTLAVIAQATFATVPLARHRATAFLVFPEIDAACAAVPVLSGLGLAAIELLDAVSLRRVAAKLPAPLPTGDPAAVLVEFQEEEAFAIAERVASAAPVLAELGVSGRFTTDPREQELYWAIRKGLFPSVGAVRAAGTAVIIEDITFPVVGLAAGVRALRGLFAVHGYADAVIFGHAKDGNLHFTLTPDLAKSAEVARYRAFMAALADLVIAHGGHLKAEHGTGRNMAPFVRAQWGDRAYDLMLRVKRLLDPQGVLNPGVLLSDDPETHLKHLKVLPAVDGLLDRCIECGFCEPSCPSRDHSTSPRQRIALLRAQARGEVVSDYGPRAVDGCAGDGLCASACPVGIDTGEAMRAHRAAGHGPIAQGVARSFAHRLDLVAQGMRIALRAAAVLPGRRLPWSSIPLPQAASGCLPAVAGDPVWLYLPTCLGRTMGSLPEDLAALCRAAGLGLRLAEGAEQQCCGQAFNSKGFPRLADAKRQAWLAAARTTGVAGVVTDTATCAAYAQDPALPILDPARFAAEVLIPRLAHRLRREDRELWLHPTCADQKQGWSAALRTCGDAIGTARMPQALGCCGMAGDKGWTLPALPAAAGARERAESAPGGLTTSITCGAAMGHIHVWTALRARLQPLP